MTRPRSALKSVALTVIVVAGCLDSNASHEFAPAEVDRDPSGKVEAQAAVALSEQSSTRDVELQGAGNDGAMVFLPLVSPVEELAWHTKFTMQLRPAIAGETPRAVFLTPSPILILPDEPAAMGANPTVLRLGGQDSADTVSLSYDAAFATDALVRGFSFAIVASAPWNLTLNITLDQEPDESVLFTIPQLTELANVTWFDGQAVASTPAGQLMVLDLSHPAPRPGWSHVEISARDSSGVEFRRYAASLPGPVDSGGLEVDPWPIPAPACYAVAGRSLGSTSFLGSFSSEPGDAVVSLEAAVVNSHLTVGGFFAEFVGGVPDLARPDALPYSGARHSC